MDQNIKLIDLWGAEIWMEISVHAFKRKRERDILLSLVFNDIKSAEEQLGEIKRGNTFVIIDSFANISIVGTVEDFNKIKIITVVNKGKDFIAKNPYDKIIILD
ncbi:hypothetical protein SAMN04244560_01048 [Thermoanaerobacter thermohydrosulfuricus]|uniref:Uncharacterized protein n=1 Tax=Thermoanaerobacter thermohydrosulfuricus TaxID=1516 RepID=A0A1G7MXR6_THETY|nr:hypothetical protein [Thermoanaerobacter thermohydrosulfuricus]SDF66502.1 hypothetical protein SAMN04244560_01048 [Thermoanaerobacter thermohydrosulfuricus]